MELHRNWERVLPAGAKSAGSIGAYGDRKGRPLFWLSAMLQLLKRCGAFAVLTCFGLIVTVEKDFTYSKRGFVSTVAKATTAGD